MAERRLDVRVAKPGQALAGRLAGRHSGEAFFDVAPCFFRCKATIASRPARASASRSPRATSWSARLLDFVERPCLERGDELALVDQPVLKSEQSEQEMAVRGGGHGGAPIVVGRSGEGPSLCVLCMSFHPILLIAPSPSRGTSLAAPFPDRFFSSCPS